MNDVVVYLDNNATTHLTPNVKQALHSVIEDDPGNPESPHSDGESARGILTQCRATIAESINAQEDQVVLTSSGSEGNSYAIRYLERKLRQEGSARIIASLLRLFRNHRCGVDLRVL